MYGDLTFTELTGIKSLNGFLKNLEYAATRSFRQSSFQLDFSSLGFLRPDLSIPAYLGIYPKDRLSPIYHLFDRNQGGKKYSHRITRKYSYDFRGKKLTYDDHNGVDFVVPPGTPIVAAADGYVVYIRKRFLRGGTTVILDHGYGLVTQYTHVARALKKIGDWVKRGEVIALSGAQGMDMTLFFPWIPPHLHFSVWYMGKPVDPFLSVGEADRPGTWVERNCPKPYFESQSHPGPYSPYDAEVMKVLCEKVRDPHIAEEIQLSQDNPHALAALLEDSLLHDELLWPPEVRHLNIRGEETVDIRKKAMEIKISLPLSSKYYDGAKFADL